MRDYLTDGFREAVTRLDEDKRTADILYKERNRFEERSLTTPLSPVPPDRDIAARVRKYTLANQKTIVVRYHLSIDSNHDILEAKAFVFSKGDMHHVVLDHKGITTLHTELQKQECPLGPARTVPAPNISNAEKIYVLLIAPVFKKAKVNHSKDADDTVVFIPSGFLFEIPLHCAWIAEENLPLAALCNVTMAFSATALIARGRILNTDIKVTEEDDLCALVSPGRTPNIGVEIGDIEWNKERFYVAAPDSMFNEIKRRCGKSPTKIGIGRLSSLEKIKEIGPEFFIFSGHGQILKQYEELGPYLCLENGDIASQFTLSDSRWLVDNKLTVLAACVTGRGIDAGGGEVAGLLRALAAAGSSAIMLSLWQVLNSHTAACIRELFSYAQKHADHVNLPRALREVTFKLCDSIKRNHGKERDQHCIEACVFALYL